MYMDERFGAWQVGDDPDSGELEFKLFFPDRAKDASQYEASRRDELGQELPDFGDPKIDRIQVVGDFQAELGLTSWDQATAPAMAKEDHPKGVVWRYRTPRALPAGFYQYKYLVTFKGGETRLVGDPCARYGGSENQNSGVVIGGSHQDVEALTGTRNHLRDLVVYELMIDDFTDEYRGARAPLDAVRERLDYLEGLGITAILFMPWTAWPGEGFNWGYTPYQYFSVEYRYANAINQPNEKLSWLKRLISDCHGRGIQVIMDGVFNHVGDAGLDPVTKAANGFPYYALYENPKACPYVGTFGGTFPGLPDLDFHNGCTQEFIRDVCFYWMDTFKIDGIRFDNTTNFFVDNEPRGLPTLLREIDDHAQAQGTTPFSLTLEHLDLSAAGVTNGTRATSYWNNELYQRTFDYLWNWRIDARIMGAINSHAGLADGKVATIYVGNHDHSHVAWQAGARDNAGALEWYRTQPYVIALFTSPGTVMVQNGQEFGEDYWLMEDDHGTGRRVKPRPLRWDFVRDNIGVPLGRLYQRLVTIRKTHRGLRSDNVYPAPWNDAWTRFNADGYGVDADAGLVIFHRWGDSDDGVLERFIVVLNFTGEARHVDIPFSTNGTWTDLLSGASDIVHDFRLANQRIESNWGRVYHQRAQ